MTNQAVLRWGLSLAVVSVLATLALFITYQWQDTGAYLSGIVLGMVFALTWSNFATAVQGRD